MRDFYIALGIVLLCGTVCWGESVCAGAAGMPPLREAAWTNVAGNVSFGQPVAMTRETVTLSNATRVATFKRSIFPVGEQRRMVLAFARANPKEGAALVRLPPKVEYAITGAMRRIENSQSRAQKGLKTREQDAEYRAQTEKNLAKYLERQVKSGVITQEELDIWRKCEVRREK